MTIYASPYGGRRYHSTPACVGLNSTVMANCYSLEVPSITRAQAAKRGLLACAICQPPPLLAVVRAAS